MRSCDVEDSPGGAEDKFEEEYVGARLLADIVPKSAGRQSESSSSLLLLFLDFSSRSHHVADKESHIRDITDSMIASTLKPISFNRLRRAFSLRIEPIIDDDVGAVDEGALMEKDDDFAEGATKVVVSTGDTITVGGV